MPKVLTPEQACPHRGTFRRDLVLARTDAHGCAAIFRPLCHGQAFVRMAPPMQCGLGPVERLAACISNYTITGYSDSAQSDSVPAAPGSHTFASTREIHVLPLCVTRSPTLYAS